MTTLRVKELREAAGMTKADLARAAVLSEKTVRKIEGGSHVPSLTTAMKLAKALNVPIVELLEANPTEGTA